MSGFASAGYGGSNANAGAGGLGQFGGPSMASWSQANQQMGQSGALNRGGQGYASVADMLNGRQSQLFGGGGGYGGFGGGGGGGGFGGNNQSMLNLANQAHNDFNSAQATNTARWQQGNQYLQNAQQGYFNDPTHQAANGLVNNLLANPDVLSQRVQGQIQGNAANMVNANANAQGRQQAGIMAAGGQTDAGSLAAMQNQVSRQGVGQLGNVQSNLDVQAALQNRQSEESAAGLGNQMAQQNYGVNQNMANSYLQNVLYQKPFDYSAYLGAMGQQGGGGMQQSMVQGGGQNYQPQSGLSAISAGRYPFGNPTQGGSTSFGRTPSPIDQAWQGAYGANYDRQSQQGGAYGGGL